MISIHGNASIQTVIDILETELVGLKPVKNRIREIAALLLIDKLEFRNYGYVRAENFLPLQTYNS
jgi:hypothetical protein